MRKATPKILDPRLVAAMKHPTRVHALSVLTDRSASGRELGEELDRDGNHIAYHLDVLRKLGLIEQVRTKPAGGGRVVEHFYRAIERPWVAGGDWREMGGPTENPGATAAIMDLINGDIDRAVRGGTFDGEDNHISRTLVILDRQGYKELTELLDATLEEGVMGIRERAANRIDSDTETLQTAVNIIHFDLPKPKD